MPEPGDHDSMDDVIAVYKAGIDRTLLRESLKRTVTERLQRLSDLHEFARKMRRGGRAAFGDGVAEGAPGP